MQYASSSPVNFVTAQTPPTILFHGDMDGVVSPSQSILLNDQLGQAGVAHSYYTYPGEGHGWTGANLTHSFAQIEIFLNIHVR